MRLPLHYQHRIITFLFALVLTLIYSSLFAIDITWTNGNGTNNWNDPLNWSTGTVPGSSDVAIFNGTSTANCSINAGVNVGGISTRSGYSGTITQLNGFTVTIGTLGLIDSSGVYIGGINNTIILNGPLTIAGGNFTSTSGDLFLGGNFTVSAGTFDPNNGTVIFNGSSNTFYNVMSIDSFYNVVMDKNNLLDLHINSADTMAVLNRLSCNDGQFTSSGNIFVLDSLIVNPDFDASTPLVRFRGNQTGHFIDDHIGETFPTLLIEKENPTDTVLFNSPTSTFTTGDGTDFLTIRSGVVNHERSDNDWDYLTITIEPEGTLVGADTLRISGNYTNTGGKLAHNLGLVIFDGSSNKFYNTIGIDTFYNVTLEKSSLIDLAISAGDTLGVWNRLSCNDGQFTNSGNIFIFDSLVVNAGFDASTPLVRFRGNQTGHFIDNHVGETFPTLLVEKENPTDTVLFNSPTSTFTTGDGTDFLTIRSGVVNHERSDNDWDYLTITIEPEGTLVGADTLRISGNYTNTGGKLAHNLGLVIFDGSSNKFYNTIGIDTFYNVTLEKSSLIDLAISAGDTLGVWNRLSCNDGQFTNSGNIFIFDSLVVNAGFDASTPLVRFRGNQTGHFIDNHVGETFPTLLVEKENPTDTVLFSSSSSTFTTGDGTDFLTIRSGVVNHERSNNDWDYLTITIEPNGTLVGADTLRISGNYTNTDGKLVHNMGLVIFDGSSNKFYNTIGIDTFYNVTLEKSSLIDLAISAGDTLGVWNRLNCNDGQFTNSGNIFVFDSLVVNADFDASTPLLRFRGNQTGHFIDNHVGETFPTLLVEKENPTDTVLFSSSSSTFTTGDGTDFLTIRSGIVDHERSDNDWDYLTITIEINGTLVGADTLRISGNYTNTDGNFVHNMGTTIFDGSGNKFYNATDLNFFYNFVMEKSNLIDLNSVNYDTIGVENTLTLKDGEMPSSTVFIVLGDVLVTPTYDGGTETLIFKGQANQNFDLTGASGKMNNDIILNKPNFSPVTLLSELLIDGNGQELVLGKGYLVTSNSNLLLIADNHLVAEGNDSSFVHGPMRKTGNEDFRFPVGKDSVYAPIFISAPSLILDHFTAEYFSQDPNDSTYFRSQKTVSLDHISECEFWHLFRTNGISNVDVFLSYEFVRSGRVDSLNELRIARWDGSLWQDEGNGGTTDSTIVSAGAVTDFGPFTLASSSIFNPLNKTIVVDLGSDAVACDSLLLDPGGGFSSYQWNTGASIQTITVTNSGAYSVIVVDSFGFQGTDTINVTIHQSPAVYVGLDTTICMEDTILLDAGPRFTSYLWSTGEVEQTIQVSSAAAYSVMVTDANSCTAMDTVHITNYPLPVIDIGPDTTTCPGESIQLDVGPGFSSYLWSDFSTGQTLLVTTTGTYSVTVTDNNNCVTLDTVMVTLLDTISPTILCISDISVQNDPGVCGAVVNYTAPFGTDNCPGVMSVQTGGLGSGSIFFVGTTTEIYTVTDASSNESSCSFGVTVADTELPSISCPTDISVQNDPGVCGAIVNYTAPFGTDNCPGVMSVQTGGLGSGSIFSVGTTTEIYTVTDASSNESSCSFGVTVTDTELPSISCPTDISVQNDPGVCGAVVNYTAPFGTDNCPGVTSMQTGGLGSGSIFSVGTTTEIYTVTDASSNESSCSFGVTVTDTELPSISCPANISVQNNPGVCGAAVTYTAPGGSDNCPGATTMLSGGMGSGSTFPVGTSVEIYTVTDASTNESGCSFEITVIDAELPAINCPADISVQNDPGVCGAAVTYTAPGGTDNCPGATTMLSGGMGSGSTFSVGTSVEIYTVMDASSNEMSCSFEITVADTESPVINCPMSLIAMECDQEAMPELLSGVSADDNCTPSASLLLAQNPSAGTILSAGIHDITISAIDQAGNSISCVISFTIHASPIVSLMPYGSVLITDPPIVLTGGNPAGGSYVGPGVIGGIFSPSLAGVGTHQITYTFTDINGCSGLASQPITVNPAVGDPIIADAGPDQTVYLGYPPLECTPLAGSALGGNPPYTFLWDTGETTANIMVCPAVTTTYSLTVTDQLGNQDTDQVMVQVVDTRCGRKNNKVSICHIPPGNPQNAHTICVSVNAVPAHLAHGDYLGPCMGFERSGINQSGRVALQAYPNPFSGQLTINYDLPQAEQVTLEILNLTGQAAIMIFSGYADNHMHHSIFIDDYDLSEGLYICRLSTESGKVFYQKVMHVRSVYSDF